MRRENRNTVIDAVFVCILACMLLPMVAGAQSLTGLSSSLTLSISPKNPSPNSAVRIAVNDWIRTTKEADGFVDLAKAVADPADPSRMAKPYDVGDALHPNDEGFRVMADAFDLRLFK